MRIHFASMERPKAAAKSLSAHLPQFKLSECQEITARCFGYSDWHELTAVTDSMQFVPTPSFLELGYKMQIGVQNVLAKRLRDHARDQLPLLMCHMLIEMCFYLGATRTRAEVSAEMKKLKAEKRDPYDGGIFAAGNMLGHPTFSRIESFVDEPPDFGKGTLERSKRVELSIDNHRILFEWKKCDFPVDEYGVIGHEVSVSRWSSNGQFIGEIGAFAVRAKDPYLPSLSGLFEAMEGSSNAAPAMAYDAAKRLQGDVLEGLCEGYSLFIDVVRVGRSPDLYADLLSHLVALTRKQLRRRVIDCFYDSSPSWIWTSRFIEMSGYDHKRPSEGVSLTPISSKDAFAELWQWSDELHASISMAVQVNPKAFGDTSIYPSPGEFSTAGCLEHLLPEIWAEEQGLAGR